MTNFYNQGNKKRLLTPERAVFFVPVIVSLFISTVLLPLIFFPRARFIREQKSEIVKLNEKIDYIPIYKEKLLEIESIFKDINDQNNRLIDLLAGKKDLSTVLSQLNNISSLHNVKIVDVKPEDKISTTLTKDNSKLNTQTLAKNAVNNDKLLVKSIEKYPIQIRIIGQYQNILNFIRDLELLQTIVIFSDLNLVKHNLVAPLRSPEDDSNYLSLSFRITFYGRKTLDKSIRKQDLIRKFSEGN